MNNTDTTRYTTTLPANVIDELKVLAKTKQIPSVNFAIRQAVYDYLEQVKRKKYDDLMRDAAKDASFINRTMKCAEDFQVTDSEGMSEW